MNENQNIAKEEEYILAGVIELEGENYAVLFNADGSNRLVIMKQVSEDNFRPVMDKVLAEKVFNIFMSIKNQETGKSN